MRNSNGKNLFTTTKAVQGIDYRLLFYSAMGGVLLAFDFGG